MKGGVKEILVGVREGRKHFFTYSEFLGEKGRRAKVAK